MVVVWVVLVALLVAVELHHLALYALFAAVGAAAGAVVSMIAPDAVVAQALTAAAVAAVGIVTVRPYARALMERRRHASPARGVHGGLVGLQVLTLDAVGDDRHVGHVRVLGERWLARSGDGQVIDAGTKVLVTAVEGTTLVVWPIDGLHPVQPPALAQPPADLGGLPAAPAPHNEETDR